MKYDTDVGDLHIGMRLCNSSLRLSEVYCVVVVVVVVVVVGTRYYKAHKMFVYLVNYL